MVDMSGEGGGSGRRRQENGGAWWVTGKEFTNNIWKKVGGPLRHSARGGRRGQCLLCCLEIPRIAWPAICLPWIRLGPADGGEQVQRPR